jgi:hypothetical protein
MSRRAVSIAGVLVLGLSLPAASEASAIVLEASGANAAAIQAAVDLFRTTLGNPNNANNPGPLADGRREINWDGGGATTTAPGPSTFTVFQTTRGGLFTTPGTGFEQAVLTNLDGIDYSSTFSTFSPSRVFSPIGSNITDATFFVPGTSTPAGVSAFGAIFSDVDLFGPTKIDFFGVGDVPLFSQIVLAGTTPSGSLSFLGVRFDGGELITHARITTGNSALGGSDGGGVDLVAMDDFIYSEPTAVPEPGTMALLGIGLLGAATTRRSRRPSPGTSVD